MIEYQCHKRVKAAQIIGFRKETSDPAVSSAMFNDGQIIAADEMTKFHRADYTPVVGDYLVEYEDGYRSISPQKAFEDGYTPIYAPASAPA